MFIYEKIPELDLTENRNMLKAIEYIAKMTKFYHGNTVMNKLLYYNVIKPYSVAIARELEIKNFRASRRQFKKIIYHKKGEFPAKIYIYLFALYRIMLNFHQPADLGERYDNITYCNFMIYVLKNALTQLLDDPDFDSLTPVKRAQLERFSHIFNELNYLDHITTTTCLKLYNNLW